MGPAIRQVAGEGLEGRIGVPAGLQRRQRQRPVGEDVAGVDPAEGVDQRVEIVDGVAGQRRHVGRGLGGGRERRGGIGGSRVGIGLGLVDAGVEGRIEVVRLEVGRRGGDRQPGAPVAVRGIARLHLVGSRRQHRGDRGGAAGDVGEPAGDERLARASPRAARPRRPRSRRDRGPRRRSRPRRSAGRPRPGPPAGISSARRWRGRPGSSRA